MRPKKKIIHYILLVDPSIINIRDLISNLPGFQYPKPIRIVRVRPDAYGTLDSPLKLFHLTSTEVKNFSNLKDLQLELEQFQAREKEITINKTTNKERN